MKHIKVIELDGLEMSDAARSSKEQDLDLNIELLEDRTEFDGLVPAVNIEGGGDSGCYGWCCGQYCGAG